MRSLVVYEPPANASESDDVARITAYYDARAAEYDRTTYELAQGDAEAAAELDRLEAFVSALPAGVVLDVGCGTGWLSRRLQGTIVALDASAAMLRRARARCYAAVCILLVSPPFPFLEDTFDRVFASSFYSHLPDENLRRFFVRESLRVARELVVIEEVADQGSATEGWWHERTLEDGRRHEVYKRVLSAQELAVELGGDVALETESWVAVRAARA